MRIKAKSGVAKIKSKKLITLLIILISISKSHGSSKPPLLFVIVLHTGTKPLYLTLLAPNTKSGEEKIIINPKTNGNTFLNINYFLSKSSSCPCALSIAPLTDMLLDNVFSINSLKIKSLLLLFGSSQDLEIRAELKNVNK